METRRAIRALYKEIDGYLQLGAAEEKRIRSSQSSSVYGEITPAAAEKLIEYMQLGPRDVFYDLGSGVGKLLIHTAMLCRPKRIVGLELSRSRHNMAKTALERAIKEKLLKTKNIEFVCADILKRNLSDATVVYTCSTAFPERFFNKLVKKISTLKAGTRFISLTEVDKLPKELSLIETLRLDMTWKRKSPVYIYQIN